MFKSVMFRPLKGLCGRDDVEDFVPLVDTTGSFVREWEGWYRRQRMLAWRYETLQERAGKLFSVADIDVGVSVGDDPSATGRRRPSAAEFMAHLTVRVATHLDIAAEARGGQRGAVRPDPSDFSVAGEFDVSGAHGSGGGVEEEPGLGAGPGGPKGGGVAAGGGGGE